jgi:membrane-bound acyltransferase YfiQ involved in biofilm formation
MGELIFGWSPSFFLGDLVEFNDGRLWLLLEKYSVVIECGEECI